jgi:predicted dinucleotide-binding enzyme
MTFGVIGSGIVGQTLAKGLQAHGRSVRIGSRTPAKLADFARETGIAAAPFADVAASAEAIVLAVHGTAAESALAEAGRLNLAGKIVIDVTNPIATEPPDSGVIRYFTGPNESLMERLQAAFPDSSFVKAFNSVGAAVMVNPAWPDGPGTMFYCGDDERAKREVAALIRAFGHEPADMGAAAAARAIEALAQLWCIPGFRHNHWTHGFRLVGFAPASQA